ncbi:MAG TPA: class I SAM-dependent methyltransferase [Bacilli bacterium]|nr:class I SAM-dependent methyltransferase [Bacilli bacterium]
MFSKRIIEIASLIPIKSSVVDVGCDHGLLDVYLTLNRKCKCIASDINENCLNQAKTNFKKFGLTKEIKIVNTDGLKNIDYKNNDYIVIAGMGTTTILDILDNNHADNLIIQSNNDLITLREELSDDYCIIDEKIIKERDIYYVVLKLKRGKSRYNDSDYILGPIIKNKKSGLYKEYKEHLLNKYNKIYNEVKYKNLDKRLEIGRIIRKIRKYC